MPSHERPIEQIQYSLKKEINELYWSIALRNFAIGMIGIFVPIYVFIYFNQSFRTTFIFYLCHFIGQILLTPFAARYLGKIGIKKSMAFGNPFLGLYLLFLILASKYGFIFIVLAVVAIIIYLSFFWPARHINFAKFVTSKKRCRQISKAHIIAALVGTIAPLIGGFIIYNFGFNVMFTISIVLLILSLIPLFFSPEVYEHYTLSWGQSFKKIFEKKNIRTSISFFFEGMEYLAGGFLFPMFIFIVIGNIETIGWVTSLSLIIALFFTYFIGWASDKKGSYKVISYASTVHFFVWLVNAFIATPLQYLIYSSFLRLAETANHLPFISIWYKKAQARNHGIDEYIVFHEIAHNFGRAAMALIIIISFTYGFTSFLFYFAIAGVSAFLFRLMK